MPGSRSPLRGAVIGFIALCIVVVLMLCAYNALAMIVGLSVLS
jgi:preprotein translocase subunit SecD